MFMEEFSRLQKSQKNADQPILPWFLQAYQLFQRSSTSAASSITSPSTPTVAIASNTPPARVPTFKIADASTSATASSLSSTPTVKPFSWTTLLPYWKLPSLGQETQLANPSSLSLKNGYDNESYLGNGNVKPQYDLPIIYPVCILPWASLGRSGDGSGISCSQNESESLTGSGIPVYQPSSFHPRTSDFSYLSGDNGIPNPTNSYRPDSRHSEITNQDRNSSQTVISINPIEPIATGFTANNSSAKKCGNFANNFSSHVSFQSSTARTSTSPVFSAISSTSSGTKFPSLPRGKSKVRTFPAARIKSSTSSGTRTKFSSLPSGKSKLRISPTARTKSSILFPPRNSHLPLVTASTSSFTTIPTSTFTNSVSIPSFPRASIPPASRVSISKLDRNSTLPAPINSSPLTVKWPNQLVIGSAFPSSATVASKGSPLSLNTPVKRLMKDLIVESKMVESTPSATARDQRSSFLSQADMDFFNDP
ncbi:hypothetical protein AVEN_13796-2 [Araneus ventricosus]|nr:hypothetical protein AVEN_13796-2 [Araneus ventricosus]